MSEKKKKGGVKGIPAKNKEFRSSRRDLPSSESALLTLMESMPQNVFIKDRNSVYLSCNNNFAGDLGIPKNEIAGKTDYDFFPREMADKYRADDQRLMDSDKSEDFEELYVRDGDEIWVRTIKTPLKNQAGIVTGILGIFHNITEVKRARQEILKQEERYRSTLDNMMEGCQIISYDWRYIYVNDAVARHGKQTKENLVGRTMMEVYPGIENTEMFSNLKRCMEERIPKQMINEFRFPDGSKGWYELSIQPAIEGIFILSFDITDRMRAEKAVQESEERFRKVVNSVSHALIVVDKQGKISMINSGTIIYFGYAEDELIGNPIEMLVPEALRGGHSRYREDFLSHPQTRSMGAGRDLYAVRKDGTEIPVEIGLTSLEMSEGTFVMASVIDITERKKAEDELRQSEDKFRYGFDHSLIGKSFTFTNGDLVVNQAFCQMVGYSEEELRKVKWKAIVHPLEIENTEKIITSLNTGKIDTIRYITRFIHKNGSVVWADVSSVMRRDNKGRPLYYTTTMLDVTEQKQAEEELIKHRENLEELVHERTEALINSEKAILKLNQDLLQRQTELENSNKELEAFAYSVSHDLRAPLRAIDGFTRVLAEEYLEKLDDEARRLGSVIRTNSKKMGQLIDDLLAFSRLGRSTMHPSVIDMKNMAIAAYNDSTSPDERNRIDFSVTDLPVITGDSNMMNQVWMNLISNALKFSAHRQKPVISIHFEKEKDHIIYHIGDNGAGFDMKYSDKLFGVFQRLHSQKDFEGTGVGLALVQRIIHRHGGQVWGEGIPDKGAKFSFSLPVQE